MKINKIQPLLICLYHSPNTKPSMVLHLQNYNYINGINDKIISIHSIGIFFLVIFIVAVTSSNPTKYFFLPYLKFGLSANELKYTLSSPSFLP